MAYIDKHTTDIEHAEGVLDLTKTGPASAVHGETITFEFTLTYASDDNSPATVTSISDNTCGALSFDGGDTDGDGLLDTDETWLYSCTYTVPDHDDEETNDPFTNTATVEGEDPDGDPVTGDEAQHTTDIEHAEGVLDITKSGPASAVHGETITFTFEVTYTSTDGSSATITSISSIPIV